MLIFRGIVAFWLLLLLAWSGSTKIFAENTVVDFQNEYAQIDAELARTMANPDTSSWNTPGLLLRVNTLLLNTHDIAERQQVETLRQKILDADRMRYRSSVPMQPQVPDNFTWNSQPFEPQTVSSPGTVPYNAFPPLDPHEGEDVRYGRHVVAETMAFFRSIPQDYRHMYTWDYAKNYHPILVLGAAAVLANTSMDMNFRDWYQEKVRSSGTDHFSKFFKSFGEGQYVLPIFGGLTALAWLTTENMGWIDTPFGEYNKNVMRAYLVGAPGLLLTQYIFGGGRPEESGPKWAFFSGSHSTASGHAFVGGIPFIMAAKMVEPIWLKFTLYFLSTLTAWSRINDDAHTLSQACLGWYLAYVACDAVNTTNVGFTSRRMAMMPMISTDSMGVAWMYRF